MAQPTRILLFTGDGKGKTTAALGMALRASGHGIRTLVVQFVKSDASTGEVNAVRDLLDIEIVQTGLGFLAEADDPRFVAHKEAASRGLSIAAEAIASGNYGMVVLDEVCYAVRRGLLEEKDVCNVLRTAPPGSCVVLTGRGATEGLIELADTVTDMRCVKHALTEGRDAQEGVER